MINSQWLELPISRKNIPGPKDIRAIEIRLYFKIALIIPFDRLKHVKKSKPDTLIQEMDMSKEFR